jgi:putative ABC transport system permease protein
MLRNYLKVAFRNLLRNKSFAVINIAGLAFSIACALIIFLSYQYENSYDNFHPDRKHLGRIVLNYQYKDGTTMKDAGVPLLTEQALRADMPQLKNVTTTYADYDKSVAINDPDSKTGLKKFHEEDGIIYVEPSFFQMFNFPWLTGNVNAAMSVPNSVALSETLADKYFGDWKNAMGKTIRMDNTLTLTVNGVMADPPENSSIPLKMAISFITFQINDTAQYNNLKSWDDITSSVNCFVQLPDQLSFNDVENLLPQFSKRHFNASPNTIKQNHIQPFTELHFNNDYDSFSSRTINPLAIDGMLLVAVFILIMACINFINLSTAMASRRSREVGVRKVLGSSRAELIRQFMGETFIIVVISAIFGVLLAWLALPLVRDLVNLPADISFFADPNIWVVLILVIFLVTALAGCYPALVLSGFQPALALKSKISGRNKSGLSLRSSLVVFQFVISQIFIISTIITVHQLEYVQHADLGLNKDAVMQVAIYNDSGSLKKLSAFKSDVQEIPGVTGFAYSSDAPISDNNWSENFSFNHSGKDEDYDVFLKFADADFFKTYGIQFLAGAGFPESDTSKAIVINETLMKKLRLTNPQDAIGKEIRLGDRGHWRPISGVIKDFHTNSMYSKVKPTYISSRKKYYSLAGVKIRSENISETIASINTIWDKYFPEYYFENSFLDENIAKFYIQDERLSKLFKLIAAIAIFISCLGLFGLVSFLITNKTKEVGVRKVLGASVLNISTLFLKYFLILVVVALLIAVPTAWYLTNTWIQHFEFRTAINAYPFILAAFCSVLIAVMTVVIQIIRAARVNPVKSLRSE